MLPPFVVGRGICHGDGPPPFSASLTVLIRDLVAAVNAATSVRMQDVPPPGGYAPVNYKRNIPKGGVSSVALAAGSVCLFGYGMWKVIMFNRQRR